MLVVKVSKTSVFLPQYGLEYALVLPPPRLSEAALGAFGLLRHSPLILRESSRDQREEALNLLRTYGKALFDSLLPPSVRSSVELKGGIFIQALHPDLEGLPWELLFDGVSFFALTQGVVRLQEGHTRPLRFLPEAPQESLKIWLQSHSPLLTTGREASLPVMFDYGNRFICRVEQLALNPLAQAPQLDYLVQGNATRRTILEALAQAPDLLFFSGYAQSGKWWLAQGQSLDLAEGEGKEALSQAVKKGLRLLILATSDRLGEKPQIKPLFDSGLPLALSLDGRISAKRVNLYFQTLLINLAQGKGILAAHRSALNEMFTQLTLSWDWIFLRLHQHVGLLEQEEGLAGYRLEAQKQHSSPPLGIDSLLLPQTSFCGDPNLLAQMEGAIMTDAAPLVCLYGPGGQLMAPYLFEFFRRLAGRESYSLSVLYYQRYGFRYQEESRLAGRPEEEIFECLTKDEAVRAHFEAMILAGARKDNPNRQLLMVYDPPIQCDLVFEDWLTGKMKQGFQVLTISRLEPYLNLKAVRLCTDDIPREQFSRHFEGEWPMAWGDLPAPQAKDFELLRITAALGKPELLTFLRNQIPLKTIWTTLFQEILASLSINRLKLFIFLYLMRVWMPKSILKQLVGGDKLDEHLDALRRIHLLEANITNEWFWVPIHLHEKLRLEGLLPPNLVKSHIKELVAKALPLFEPGMESPRLMLAGFTYLIQHKASLGQFEPAARRSLQLAKRVARIFPQKPALCQGLLVQALDLSLATQNPLVIRQNQLAILEVMERLPMAQSSIQLLEWMAGVAESERAWSQVAEIQMKLASLYSRLGQKEKAVAYLTSVIQLNNDIKMVANRSQNMISIALLLVELGEMDKLAKLMAGAQFDLTQMSRENLARLWLVDGYLQLEDGNLAAAAKAFLKSFGFVHQSTSPALLAATYGHLAEYAHRQEDAEAYLEYLTQEAKLWEQAGKKERAAKLHEGLAALFTEWEEPEGALAHLEWLFAHHQEAENHQRMGRLAHQLARLYHHAGRTDLSAHYYGIAQKYAPET